MVSLLTAFRHTGGDEGLPLQAVVPENAPSLMAIRKDAGVVLVLRDPAQPARPALGLRVDDVLTMLDVADTQIHPLPDSFQHSSPRVDGLLDVLANDRHGTSKVLLQALDAQDLLARLTGG
ncbi:MAG: hypothetical protein DI587_34275 [Variovorax paradoxus]|nr:MAG: hypothetical protein DI583_34275 [Variovorax paradoxus]PZQ01742.1 MAG: hypothetical protein DI587_34275 [Variovorax paradoxus]